MSSDRTDARQQNDTVWQLIERGAIKEAITACDVLNKQHPQFASGWNTASHIAYKLRNLSMAITAIDRALTLQPGQVDWVLHKARCLGQQGQFAQVLELIEPLREKPLATAWQCATLGLLLSRMDQQGVALALYQRAVELEPRASQHYYNLASVQRFLGNFDEAEAALLQAIKLNPLDYDAYKLRSDLKTWTVNNNHIPQLRMIVQSGIDDPRGEVQLSFALAKELEDIGQCEESFSYLQRGANKRRQHMRYDVAGDIETMAEIARVFDWRQLSAADDGCDSNEPIFVLGMPRTGTTLVERILGSHSQVFAAGELNNFAMEMTRAVGKKGLSKQDMVAASAALDFSALGEAYLNSTRNQTGHTPRFIDKLPLNFLYTGLIHMALPNAKIVHVQRHPLDTCYAVYKTLFQDAYPFSYDLTDLARYYVAYHQLMAHWHAALPGAIATLEYEKLVRDQEGESRLLIEAMGLDWEPQCLDFHASSAASTTASASQVREPVYQNSVARWRNYEEQLKPLTEVLREAGIDVD